MGYIRYTISFQYTFKEHDPKTCYPYRILGFRICFCFPGATKLKCQSQSHLRHQKKRIEVSFVAFGTKKKKGRSFSAFPDLLD